MREMIDAYVALFRYYRSDWRHARRELFTALMVLVLMGLTIGAMILSVLAFTQRLQ